MVFDTVKFFRFHGVILEERGKTGVASCPFCERESKFYVDLEKCLWSCKVCGQGNQKGGGNQYTFLKLLLEANVATDKQYRELARDRKLLYPETLKSWGVIMPPTLGEWLIPAYSPDGKLVNVYKYVLDPKGSGKQMLLSSPGLSHGVFGVPLAKGREERWVCEGPWDGMALWEVFSRTKFIREDLTATSNKDLNLLQTRDVYAVPGCSVFKDEWPRLLEGSLTVFAYDSDHPKEVRGKTLEPVGMAGTKRAINAIALHADKPPRETRWIEWGPDGFDPDLESGTDIRDILGKGATVDERVPLLATLFSKIVPTPPEWVGGGQKESGKAEITLLKCEDWKTLVNAWRLAMKWIPGLDHGLASCLATVTSTMSVGSQLWIRLIGIPSCGKSTLCEALNVNKEYVLSKSTMRGFHSGYRETGKDDEDNSLLMEVNGKTLVTKDGDTLLQSPNLSQILSEARDVYDGSSRTSYRNKASRDYEGIRFSWILSGTTSLRQLDKSEVGERFIDVVVMDRIDPDLEDDILLRVARKAWNNMQYEANGKPESRQDPDLTKAMQLTGGYVQYLRRNAQRLMNEVQASDEAIRHCINLGKFVAYMRARPSWVQDESDERELGARLVEQIIRYAKCVAVVLNEKSLSKEVLRRATMVALDTARGKTLRIADELHRAAPLGHTAGQLVARTGDGEEESKGLLRFLGKIKAVEKHTVKAKGDGVGRVRYRLTEAFATLYSSVVPEPEEE